MPTMRLDPSVIAPVKRRERQNLPRPFPACRDAPGFGCAGRQERALPRRHEFEWALALAWPCRSCRQDTRRKKRSSNKGRRWRVEVHMMPIEVCVYCSRKIEEKEKSVNSPVGAAHLACAQKATSQTKAS
jgi:hypothetical protein